MASDKGVEGPKPPEPNVTQPPPADLGKEKTGMSSAFREAAARALRSLGRTVKGSFRRTASELPRPIGQSRLNEWLGPGPQQSTGTKEPTPAKSSGSEE